jgi:3-hydroxybutyryl-CoA dehydratase
MSSTRPPRRLETLNNYFDDLMVGDRYETGTRVVSAEDVRAFAQLSGDLHPYHHDEELAARGPFGALFASGAFTLAVLTGLQYELMAAGNDEVEAGHGAVLAWYGMDDVRFLRPVLVGDRLKVDGTITALEDRGRADTGLVTMSDEIVNQRGEIVMALRRTWLQRKCP